jgi:hypothetical protein
MKKHTKLPTPLVDLVFKDDDSKKRTALADLEIGATVEATIKTVTDFMTPSSLKEKSSQLRLSELSFDLMLDKLRKELRVRLMDMFTFQHLQREGLAIPYRFR